MPLPPQLQILKDLGTVFAELTPQARSSYQNAALMGAKIDDFIAYASETQKRHGNPTYARMEDYGRRWKTLLTSETKDARAAAQLWGEIQMDFGAGIRFGEMALLYQGWLAVQIQNLGWPHSA